MGAAALPEGVFEVVFGQKFRELFGRCEGALRLSARKLYFS
jgi:hypothetical protein